MELLKKIERGEEVFESLEQLNDAIQDGHKSTSKKERDYLIEVLMKTAKSTDAEIKQEVFNILISFVPTHYKFLGSYCQSILKLTTQTINNYQDRDTGKHAIELISTLAEIEAEDEIEDEGENKKYIQQSLSFVLPVLLAALSQQDEEDEYSLAVSAATALSVILPFFRENEKSQITKFISENINTEFGKDNNWKKREAAAMALGACVSVLPKKFVSEMIEPLHRMIKEGESDLEKETTVWTIGKIAGNSQIFIYKNIKNLIQDLLSSVSTDVPKIASITGFALFSIANELKEQENQEPALSTLIEGIPTILSASVRGDDKLSTSAHELLNVIVLSIPDNSEQRKPVLSSLLNEYLDRANKAQNDETKGKICAGIQTCLECMNAEKDDAILSSFAPKIFSLISSILSGGHSTDAFDEAILTLHSFATVMEEKFLPYMEKIAPVLLKCLQTTENPQSISVLASAIGEISRSISKNMSVYASDYIDGLLIHIKTNPKQFEPVVIATLVETIADIAMAIGKDIEPFMKNIFDTVSGKLDSEELVSAFFTLCTGVLHGLATDEKQSVLLPYVERMVVMTTTSLKEFLHHDFLPQVTTDVPPFVNDSVGLLLDIVQNLGPQTKNILQAKKVAEILVEVESTLTDFPDVTTNATLALEELQEKCNIVANKPQPVKASRNKKPVKANRRK